MKLDRPLPAGSRPHQTLPIDPRAAALAVLTAGLALTAMWAVTIGPTRIPASDIIAAVTRFDASHDHLVIATVRVPRVLAGIIAGAALAVAGAIMQAVTNNPLASPGLLGVNAGASFGVVMALTLWPTLPTSTYVWAAFAGAAVAATIVYSLGSMGVTGATPVKLALAGAIVSAFVASLTSAVLIFDKTTLDAIRFWSVGSLAGRSMTTIASVSPYILAGLAAAMLTRRQITTLSLGADVARTVGQNLVLWRAVAAVTVVLLAGSAVAVAGPIGFVGLVVPHAVRLLTGLDYRWILPFCAVGGALLVTGSDALARSLLPERELPVGITMALIGAPFFVYLARYRIGRSR